MNMYRELLTRFPLINLVLVGELIFFAIFSLSLFWVFRKGSKDFYSRLAALPLNEGDQRHE